MSKVKKIKMVDGKMTFVDVHEREEVLKLIGEIFDEIETKDEEIKHLKKKLDKPEEEKLAELKAKLDKVETELNELYFGSLYVLTKEDKKTARDFWEKHKEHCPTRGRNMAYTVYSSGIGSCIEYTCRTCGEGIDLTDVNRW